MLKSFSLKLPATTANLGSGFDTLGLALSLHNIYTIHPNQEEHSVTNTGEGEDLLNDPENNLFFKAYTLICKKYSLREIPLSLTAKNSVPLSSGLGSSATAILAGIVSAYIVHDLKIEYSQILLDALPLENHLDNLAACLYGGFTIALDSEEKAFVSKVNIEYPLSCWIVYPHLQVVTAESRKSLPDTVSFKDAVFNISRVSLLTEAIISGRVEYLAEGMNDRLHESFRAHEKIGYELLKEKLKGENFYSGAISGSGPSMVFFCAQITDRLRGIAKQHFAERSIPYSDYDLKVDNKGLEIDYTK